MGAGDWALALVPAAMVCLLATRHVWDVDIFWQLKLGELILRNGGPIAREPFAATHVGDSLPAVAWLGQAVMAFVRHVGGWGALRIFDALCWLGGFWAVALACRNRGASATALGLALIVPFFAALPTASIRPQSFSALCFGLLLAIQRLGLRPVTQVALCAPLLVLWQNLHPSVSVAVPVMAVIAGVGWVGWLRDRARPMPLAPTAIAVLAGLALFLTPDGVSILAISAQNARASIAIGASEWMPIWIPANLTNAVPVVIVAALALYLAFRHRDRVDAGEAAVALLLFAMTAVTYRFVLFWAVAMVPVIARLSTAPDARQARPPHGLGLLAIAMVAAVMPLAVPTHFSENLPLAAIARLKQEHVRGTIYADFPYGGPIIDAGYPEWRVAFDGRYYRYTHEEWQMNGAVEGGYMGLGAVVAHWHPAAFLLNARHNPSLSGELARSAHWRRVFARDGIVVFVPR